MDKQIRLGLGIALGLFLFPLFWWLLLLALPFIGIWGAFKCWQFLTLPRPKREPVEPWVKQFDHARTPEARQAVLDEWHL